MHAIIENSRLPSLTEHNAPRYYVEMVLPNSSAEATGVVVKGDILEVVDDKTTEVCLLLRLACAHALPATVH